MKKLSNLDMSREAKLLPINEVASIIGLSENEIEQYGDYKAKIKFEAIKKRQNNQDGNLILVTATSPTKFGEGKSTVTVGLAQALQVIGKKVIICLREPSLGPVFGIKGGATGGGYSQVLPVDEINLHFTGDLHAISAANNLIAAILDNHLQMGNALKIDVRQITWRRAIDMNDRSLRNIVIGLGGKSQGVPRQDHFDITVASEIMAVLCLSTSLKDLKDRVSKIIVASNTDGQPVTVSDLKVAGAVTALLKDALKPNLVQTTEHVPALVHGGPFANIAHGCNSLIATKFGLKLADYIVTEAGFGGDLGAEKFLNIKSRIGQLKPKAVVIVTTVRALKHHGKDNLQKGLPNLEKHIENMKKFGLIPVVSINKFPTDSDLDLQQVKEFCQRLGTKAAVTDIFMNGGKGGTELAEYVVEAVENNKSFNHLYEQETTAQQKIETIAKEIYGADGVDFSDTALNQIKKYESWGYSHVPVCMAKTQYSFSDNPTLLGRPKGFRISIKSVRLSAGAGFMVAITGDIMTMPGLPRVPAAEGIDVNDNEQIIGM